MATFLFFLVSALFGLNGLLLPNHFLEDGDGKGGRIKKRPLNH